MPAKKDALKTWYKGTTFSIGKICVKCGSPSSTSGMMNGICKKCQRTMSFKSINEWTNKK
jgi:hypothetical protein